MSDTVRSVKVRLSADVSGLVAGYATAKKATTDTFNAATKVAAENKQTLNDLGTTAGKFGLVAAAGVAVATKRYADFDRSLSGVRAASGATGAELERLRGLALQLGADSQFSASEAADGITELSKAGVSTADIMSGALKGSLDLAAAGQIGVGQAAEFTATALNQFKLRGDQATHVADLLAAGAGKAQGEVADMALALDYAGVPAANLGVSIEETAGTIALLAKNGIIGEKAGTSLRGMLASLTSPSDKAAKTMAQLGIEVFDAQGKFVGLDGVAEQLQTRMAGLTDQERANYLGRIFGNEQLQAANVLYREGAKGVQSMTDAVNDQGFAAEQAATKTDNLYGDIERLGGALDSLLIGSAEGSNTPLRGIVQGLTDVIDTIEGLPQPAKDAAFQIAGIVAVTGGGLFLGSRVVTNIASTKQALDDLGTSSNRARTSLAAIGRVGVALVGLEVLTSSATALGDAMMKSYPGVEQLTKSLLELDATRNANKLADEFDTIGTSIQRLTDPTKYEQVQHFFAKAITLGGSDSYELRSARKEIDALDAAFANLVASGSPEVAARALDEFATATDLSASQQAALVKQMPLYKEAMAGASNQTKLAAEAADPTATAVAAMGGEFDKAADDVDSLTDALKRANDILDARSTRRAYEQAVRDAGDSLKERKDLLEQINDVQADGARERAEIRRRAGEAGADGGGDTAEARRKLADARHDDATAKTASERESAIRRIASLQKDLADKETTRGRAARDANEQINDSYRSQNEQLTDLKEQLRNLHPGVDPRTQSGSDNQEALDAIAKTAIDHVDTARLTGKRRDEFLAHARDDFLRQARAFGVRPGRAETLADKLGLSTTKADLTVKLHGADATQRQIDTTGRSLRELDGTRADTYVTHHVSSIVSPARASKVADQLARYERADGGPIPGSSPHDRADNILVAATAGEHMFSVAEVRGAGGHDEVARLRYLARSGQLRGFADGGPIGVSASRVHATVASNGATLGAGTLGLIRELAARQVPAMSVGTVRHNDMRETERWMRTAGVHRSGGGVTF